MNCARRRPEGPSPVGCPGPSRAGFDRQSQKAGQADRVSIAPTAKHQPGASPSSKITHEQGGPRLRGEPEQSRVQAQGQPISPPHSECPAALEAPKKGPQFELRPPKSGIL